MGTERKMSNFEVLRLVRDARNTKHAERHVLNALVLRANPEKAFSCFPSIDQLADDTQLDGKTVQRTLKVLSDSNLIRRIERPFSSNVFFLNVPLLAEQAAKVLAAEKKKKTEMAQSPFGEVTVPAGATSEADNNTTEYVDLDVLLR